MMPGARETKSGSANQTVSNATCNTMPGSSP